MKTESRQNIVSFNSIARGGLVGETQSILAHWDFSLSRTENFSRAATENYLGLSSSSHVRDIVSALRRRLDPEERERPLTVMAKANAPSHLFRACLLWHLTLDEFLLREFLMKWLFPAFERGRSAIHSEDLYSFVRDVQKRGKTVKAVWSETTLRRAASGLLKIATDFGLLSVGVSKNFQNFVVPEEAFLYVLHALVERMGSAAAAIHAPDWRVFLMRPADVEHELLRLHQYRKIEYQVAGSLVQLSLPYTTSREYAERMVA